MQLPLPIVGDDRFFDRFAHEPRKKYVGTVGPKDKLRVGTERLRKIEKTVKAERRGRYACTRLNGIESIALLFDVRRNHKYGFTHIHGFADGFETGGTGIGHATCHVFEKQFVVERMEAQCLVYYFLGGFALLIPKELHRNVRTFLMPVSYLRRETGIDHIAMNIIAGRYCLAHGFSTQQRRNDIYSLPTVVRHSSERQCQHTVSTDGCHAGEQLQHGKTYRIDLGKTELAVQKKILVTDADAGNIGTANQICKASQKLIEIDDSVGTNGIDTTADEPDA